MLLILFIYISFPFLFLFFSFFFSSIFSPNTAPPTCPYPLRFFHLTFSPPHVFFAVLLLLNFTFSFFFNFLLLRLCPFLLSCFFSSFSISILHLNHLFFDANRRSGFWWDGKRFGMRGRLWVVQIVAGLLCVAQKNIVMCYFSVFVPFVSQRWVGYFCNSSNSKQI